MSDDVFKLIEKADKLAFQDQYKLNDLIISASYLLRNQGNTLMVALAEYFRNSPQEVKVEVVEDEGKYICPNCKKGFITQQGLVGHGPKRCAKIT